MSVRACVGAVMVTLVVAAGARADGLPVPVDYSEGAGVGTSDSATRFVTIGDSRESTLLEIAQDGGEVLDTRTIDGHFSIPAVAVDGTASGVSHDGSRLVLINPRTTFPRETTEFFVLGTKGLKPDPGRIVLDGDFSFDALSPDGETMYLVEYPDPKDPTSYQVRAYDIDAGRLDPDPILDTEEAPGEMRGFPTTRATSPDGRWEYTVYDGAGGEPFIHALDVVDGATVCLDLPMVRSRDANRATVAFTEDSRTATVSVRDEPVASVDVDGFEVTEVETAAFDPAAEGPQTSGGGPSALALVGIGVLSLLVATMGLRRLRR